MSSQLPEVSRSLRPEGILQPQGTQKEEAPGQPQSTPIYPSRQLPSEARQPLSSLSSAAQRETQGAVPVLAGVRRDLGPCEGFRGGQGKAVKVCRNQLRNIQQPQQNRPPANREGDGAAGSGLSPPDKLKDHHQKYTLPPAEPELPAQKQRPTKSYCYEEADNSEAAETFKFPFVNEYLHRHGGDYLKTLGVLDGAREKAKEQLGEEEVGEEGVKGGKEAAGVKGPGTAGAKGLGSTFINCDVKYFNWKLFSEEVGKFEVVVIDPPWRIKGAQQNDSQFMFSNCKFSLQYNTMANSEIGRIPLHLLSDQGFIFLWILNSQLDASLEIMEGWGYELVEEIVWVKLKDQKISLTHGYYFMHSYEVCLVGYKSRKDSQGQLRPMQGLSWNTLFAEVREKSQKPEDLYAVLEMMFRGGSKVEIFARNHNLRFGVFGIGNELGESYDKWLLRLECDGCGQVLRSGSGEKRFKAKQRANYDLCGQCIGKEERGDFFELVNDVDENIKHEYISCNHCGSEPIWGIRFQCVTCHDFDICENCYDQNLRPGNQFHPPEHEFVFLEVPVFGNGFHIHQAKCSSCYQNPIIGIYFTCSSCKTLNLCQKCYFERPPSALGSLMNRHKLDHQLEVIFESQVQTDKRYECFSCKHAILENCWMCENCYNFFFCQACHDDRQHFKSLYANTHKKYHVLTKIF